MNCQRTHVVLGAGKLYGNGVTRAERLPHFLPHSQPARTPASTGVDYFFSSTMNGHDTSYSPDGTAVNPREEFTYSDADEAVSEPKLESQMMLGFNYYFSSRCEASDLPT
jgi:hypothetical protein